MEPIMNKFSLLVLILFCTGTAFAQPDDFRPDRDQHGPHSRPLRPSRMASDEDMPPPPPPPGRDIQEQHRLVHQLIKSVRDEKDETRRAELIEQLRDQLGKAIDQRNGFYVVRIQQMEDELARRTAIVQEQLAGLRERMEKAQASRDEDIESELQHILDGHPWPPPPPEGFHPPGKGRRFDDGDTPGPGFHKGPPHHKTRP